MVTDLPRQKDIAERREAAKFYLQERDILKIRVEYKKHWQDFDGQTGFQEAEMTYRNGKTKKEAIPEEVYNLVYRILARYCPRWKKGSKGHIKWNLEDDGLEIQHEGEGAFRIEKVSCKKIYGRKDPAVSKFLNLQKAWIAGARKDTKETKLFFMIKFRHAIAGDIRFRHMKSEVNANIDIYARSVSRNEDDDYNSLFAVNSPENDEARAVMREIYEIAEKNAKRDKRPLAEGQRLESVTIEATRKGKVMIESVHIFEEPEILKPYIFVIMPNGKKAEVRVEEPTPEQITSRIILIIPVSITLLAFVPLLGLWGWPRYFGQYVNITAVISITTTAILAWIRFVIRQKTWKEALKKRTRRLAGIPEHPNAQMDKPNRFLEREWMYIKDYFNFVRTFTERRRGNVIAIEEATRTEKGHDHATATMRKQEEANAVAFLRANYAKHEKSN